MGWKSLLRGALVQTWLSVMLCRLRAESEHGTGLRVRRDSDIPLKRSIRVPLKGSCKGSIGFRGLQYPLIKEYTLKYFRIPNMIKVYSVIRGYRSLWV